MAQPGLPSRPTSSYSYSSFSLPLSALPDRRKDDNNYNKDDDYDDDDADESSLPFPAALPRNDFLAPDFDAAAYLSALHTGGPASRHQTLEDLRAELRERGAAISAELLELVNANYAAFLGLGDELKGGEDRVEDVRVALLGFRRAVEELRARVRERRAEVGALTGELHGVRRAVELGRRMLELDERVAGLEARLAVGSIGRRGEKKNGGVDGDGDGNGDGDEDEDDWDGDSLISEDGEEEREGDDGAEFVSSSPSKLASLAREYLVAERIADSIGRDLPFVKKMEERMLRCRNTILLDLSTALKEARRAGPRGQGRVLRVLGVYRVLDAQADAVRVLKE